MGRPRIVAPPASGVPRSATPGLPLVTQGLGALAQVGAWPDYSTHGVDKTWLQPGDIGVESGADNYLNGWFVPVPPGQAVGIVGVWGVIRAGTSVTVKFQLNGADIDGLTGIEITSTIPTSILAQPSGFVDLWDGAYIKPIITAVSDDSPDNLTLGLFLSRQIDP